MLERHTWTAGVRLDSRIALLLGLLCLADIQAAETLSPQLQDPHRNAAGFFDIHVCNWPDRDLFFMSLFSTPRFEEVEQVEVFFPNGSLLTRLDLGNYRTIHHKEKPDKRVFMNEIDVPPGAPDGWYSTRVYYQVFLRDLWNDGKMIFSSKLLDEPRVQLPPDLLEAGGYYSWIVHARDLNEHYMLGDFNHGSISPVYTFSIEP